MVPPGPPGMHGHHGPDGPFGGPMMGMPFLRGLSLSDAQQDKVFEIMHAQAPALRLRGREVRQSREALFALARSERFDDAKATALADTGARAASQIALMRARSAAAVWQVLTPEQRKQADEMAARRGMPRDGGRGPRCSAARAGRTARRKRDAGGCAAQCGPPGAVLRATRRSARRDGRRNATRRELGCCGSPDDDRAEHERLAKAYSQLAISAQQSTAWTATHPALAR